MVNNHNNQNPMSGKPPSADVENPSCWRFSWEAQSHTSILRLLLFNPYTNPSAQCADVKLKLLPHQSLLTVSFLERESLTRTTVRVPVPRLLVDPELPIHFKVFDDHIEAKLVLLLPVDHPLVSGFDSVLCGDEIRDEFRPFSLDYDINKLSCMEEVHFYCRNCSNKLTNGLSCFKEMPSVNWREVADNWFGNCCCSFGGVSEKLVTEYAKSYTCTQGVCLLNTTSVLICKNDLFECEFPDINLENGTSNNLDSGDSLSCALHALKVEETGQGCDSGSCCSDTLPKGEGNIELLENQRVFLDGFLGNGFMVGSSGLSKNIRWVEFLCPQCSCLVGAYPCMDVNAPLDGGVRLFKCYISTCFGGTGSDDVFRNYTLERMFASQLLENAEDELSFRTVVRDMQTKSPALQIVLMNPNTWVCAGGSLNPEKTADKLVMHPSIKLLFSASSQGMGFDSRNLDDWVRKNQADEIYMFSSQIIELTRVLEVARNRSPQSCTMLQGLYLSSMRR